MAQCRAAEDGVIHGGHFYIPISKSDLDTCGGVLRRMKNEAIESRFLNLYCVACWISVDGVQTLFKTEYADDFIQAKEWLTEMNIDPDIQWFIVHDYINTESTRIDVENE